MGKVSRGTLRTVEVSCIWRTSRDIPYSPFSTRADRRRSRSVRESTTAEEEPPKREGPLSSCVIVLSAKLKVILSHRNLLFHADFPAVLQRADHPRLVDLLTSLGASHVKSFGATVTHLVHASNKSNESFADFKAARKARLPIVHPEWLEKVSVAAR